MVRAGIGNRVEGVHAVAAAVAAGRVTHLTVEKGRMHRPDVAAIVALAESRGIAMFVVDDVRPLAETTAPQGIVADARPLGTASIEQLVDRDAPAAVLVLDRVEDPRNLGAVARSAVAAGVGSLVVASRRAAPLSATALKAAAGAFEHLAIAVVGSIAEAVRDLHSHGLWTVGLDAGGQRSLFELDLLTDPTALVLGAEGKGLSRLVRDRLDVVVRIPIEAPMESLNVAAAATLAVYELARARGRIT